MFLTKITKKGLLAEKIWPWKGRTSHLVENVLIETLATE